MLGPFNPIIKQVSYDIKTGKIYKYHVKSKNILDEIASRHDTCYATVNSKKVKMNAIGLWLKKLIIFLIKIDHGELLW